MIRHRATGCIFLGPLLLAMALALTACAAVKPTEARWDIDQWDTGPTPVEDRP